MKKSVIILASALMAFASIGSLAGCGGSDSASQAQTATAAAGSADSKATASASITADDVVFVSNGVKVELNSDADEAVAALGDYLSVESQLSCHGEGDDKTYTYDGFVLNTYPLDGKDRVLEVAVNTEGIATSKGIQVGDSADKVTQTYGDGYRKVGMYYAYDAGDGKSLQFFIENDAVKEIDYYYDV